MELMKTARKHGSFVSEAIYVTLNIGLAVAVFALTHPFLNLPILAYTLVVLSKWRILAVRPRFWWDNFQANLLDLLLGVSVVTLLVQAQSDTVMQLGVTILYVLWLVFLKPMTSRFAVQTQAMVAQFAAITAFFSVAYLWPSWVVVIAVAAIGYVSARHYLGAYEEDDITFISLLWGLLLAEVGWVAYHWTFAYPLGSCDAAISIPQIAIILTLLSYVVSRCYGLYKKNNNIKFKDILWPVVFTGVTILTILIFFNNIANSCYF